MNKFPELEKGQLVYAVLAPYKGIGPLTLILHEAMLHSADDGSPCFGYGVGNCWTVNLTSLQLQSKYSPPPTDELEPPQLPVKDIYFGAHDNSEIAYHNEVLEIFALDGQACRERLQAIKAEDAVKWLMIKTQLKFLTNGDLTA